MSMTRTVKILFGFIIALLIPIVLVIGYMYLAMFNHADPTSPLYALFPRDLPDWLPVDYAIKAGVILALMFVVLLIYMPSLNIAFIRKSCKRVSNRL